jgi:hypothetical protein
MKMAGIKAQIAELEKQLNKSLRVRLMTMMMMLLKALKTMKAMNSKKTMRAMTRF